jgi:hypothetical protein
MPPGVERALQLDASEMLATNRLARVASTHGTLHRDACVTFLRTAMDVLAEASQPMSTSELVDAVLRRRVVRSTGKSPRDTIASALYIFIRDNPDGPVRKLQNPGQTRAVRGSVRWIWVGPQPTRHRTVEPQGCK